jgi:hypothetical protein
MSEQPTATATRPPAAKAPGKKYAGLTRNQWFIVGGVFAAALGYILWKRHEANAAAATSGTAATNQGSDECTDSNGNPVDCDQEFAGELAGLQNALDQAQAQGGGSAGGTGVTGTVGSTTPTGTDSGTGATGTTQPTGTTTTGTTTATSTAWAYPAPSGLKASQVAATGYYLNWNPVKGPQGQTPTSYTVATYDSTGKEVNQHNTVAGSTQTSEYGAGGKGLPKGTYHTNVWANGGPQAPPHATVTVTLKG